MHEGYFTSFMFFSLFSYCKIENKEEFSQNGTSK